MENQSNYIDLLRNKLFEQQEIYERLKQGDISAVCYKGYQDKKWGTRDANAVNRLRLAYYLLYEKVEDEQTIACLFQEELKDRETNSFQGIGDTIRILTHLLRKYNQQHQYDELFHRAKNANFDCACGYDVDDTVSDDIYNNDLLDSIYLCQDLDYKDLMERLVAEWKVSVAEWNESNRRILINFYSFLGKETENEELYQEQLASIISTGTTSEIIRAYVKLIQYYLSVKKYETAYQYLNEVLETTNYKEISKIRLFGNLLEAAFEIIANWSKTPETLWQWAKDELKDYKNKYGNLYTKGIEAAKAVSDNYVIQLQNEYLDWRKRTGIR